VAEAVVDVVVVSYNSSDQLRPCVEPLAAEPDLNVIVVDNDSPDRGLEAIADLDLTAIQTGHNGGFAFGCNRGWRAGAAPFVLFLNPDARIAPESVQALARALEAEPGAGAAGPRIEEDDGSAAPSQRRFPTLASTYAHALFLHRLFPRAAWASELVRDPEAYDRRGSPEWVSGAAIMVRRPLLERLGGLDEGFFLYCEDKDLCRRIRDLGHDVRYEPAAVARHEGGASAPRPGLLPVLAASRVRYARKHSGPVRALVERAGWALMALTHSVVSRGGRASRAGHLAALRAVLRPPRGGPATR
jgi:GT2 family glycosyltransferase